MTHRQVETGAEYVARFEGGRDWRDQIESLAVDVGAEAGWFTGLGAVTDAEVWFYDQTDLEYRPVTFEEPLEVAGCVGNVSLLDGEPFAHTHAVLSRSDGSTVAGHLNRATVFAGELYLRTFREPLERTHHEPTDLDLWL